MRRRKQPRRRTMRRTAPTLKAPNSPQISKFRRYVRWFNRLVLGAVGLAGFIASVAGIWGPFWPTDPEIHPQNTVNGSSFILPFTVQNHSVLFGIQNAEFTCGFGQLYLTNPSVARASFPNIAF